MLSDAARDVVTNGTCGVAFSSDVVTGIAGGVAPHRHGRSGERDRERSKAGSNRPNNARPDRQLHEIFKPDYSPLIPCLRRLRPRASRGMRTR